MKARFAGSFGDRRAGTLEKMGVAPKVRDSRPIFPDRLSRTFSPVYSLILSGNCGSRAKTKEGTAPAFPYFKNQHSLFDNRHSIVHKARELLTDSVIADFRPDVLGGKY